MRRLDQRVVIITGAAGALGRATALRCADEGAVLCLADRVGAAEVGALLAARGARCIDVITDVTDAAAVDLMVARTLAAFGRVDVLVNIAGITSQGASDDVSVAEWQRVLDVNLTSAFLCCKAVLPTMRAQRHGRIVNMSSILGKNGGNPRPWIDPAEQQRAGNVAYGVSKAGLIALTAYLAKENAHHVITVNAVAPGPIATGMTANFPASLQALIPVGRMGVPEEVADAVAFLAGDQAGFVTGEVLDVNGGAWVD